MENRRRIIFDPDNGDFWFLAISRVAVTSGIGLYAKVYNLHPFHQLRELKLALCYLIGPNRFGPVASVTTVIARTRAQQMPISAYIPYKFVAAIIFGRVSRFNSIIHMPRNNACKAVRTLGSKAWQCCQNAINFGDTQARSLRARQWFLFHNHNVKNHTTYI